MNNRIADTFVSLVFPRRCPICDRPVKPFGALACTECEERVRYVHDPVCCKCGKPLEDETAEYCDDCMKTSHVFRKGMALFEYGSVSDSIYRFKYRGRREYAEWYGAALAGKLGDEILDLHPDALVPVPIHRSKMRRRGYNQAELIAKALSRHLGIPVADGLVVRCKATEALKDHTPEERNNILRGAFKIGLNDVKLKTIVIIDDIYTTGATIDGVAQTLMADTASDVFFVTLAIGRGV